MTQSVIEGENPAELGSPGSDCPGTKPKTVFYCNHCPYSSNRRNNLKRHEDTMHSLLQTPRWCCRKFFSSNGAYKKHKIQYHLQGYKCDQCDMTFSRRALLVRHSYTHTGLKPFLCPVCKLYATSHKSNLERHMKKHDKETESTRTGNAEHVRPHPLIVPVPIRPPVHTLQGNPPMVTSPMSTMPSPYCILPKKSDSSITTSCITTASSSCGITNHKEITAPLLSSHNPVTFPQTVNSGALKQNYTYRFRLPGCYWPVYQHTVPCDLIRIPQPQCLTHFPYTFTDTKAIPSECQEDHKKICNSFNPALHPSADCSRSTASWMELDKVKVENNGDFTRQQLDPVQGPHYSSRLKTRNKSKVVFSKVSTLVGDDNTVSDVEDTEMCRVKLE